MSTLIPRPRLQRDRPGRRNPRRDLLVEVDSLASTLGTEVVIEVDDLLDPTSPSVLVNQPANTSEPVDDRAVMAQAITKALSLSEQDWAERDRAIAAKLAISAPHTEDAADHPASAQPSALNPGSSRFTVKTAADWLREADEPDDDEAPDSNSGLATSPPFGDDATQTATSPGVGLTIFDSPMSPDPSPARRTAAVRVAGVSLQLGLSAALIYGLVMGALIGFDRWEQAQDTARYCAAAPTMNPTDTQSTFQAVRQGQPQAQKVYAPFAAGVAAFGSTSASLTPQVNQARADLAAAHQALLDTRGTVIDENRIDRLTESLMSADAAFRNACAAST